MDIKALEHPTLKVPYEILNKKFRTSQKIIDREVNHVSTSLTDLEKLYTLETADRSDILQQLDKVQEMLEQLQEKGGEGVTGVAETGRVCKRRIEHLKEGCNTDNSDIIQQKQWRKLRLDRFLVEHLLRSGLYDTAIKLSQQSGLEDLTDIEVFLAAKEVEETLSKGDSSKC
jgi:macrophage erythroblast attacher